MPARFEAPLLDGDRVAGVRLRVGEARHELAARWVVLATGAVPQGLMAADVCERRTPSGVALRGYVRNEAMVGRITGLEIVWHRRLAGGYGWIFPAPGGVFNIGTGLTGSHAVERGDGGLRMQDVNLRQMLDAFCEVHAPAGELMRGGTLQGEIKGAPLRCSLGGARWSRPGLLVTGEAAGSTYAFTGEGIGKALETGLLAAEAIDLVQPDATVRQRYEAALRALAPRFSLYEKAAHVNHRPWLTDLVIWRANRSEGIRRRMSGVLEETQNPGRLLSWRGITRLMLE
jgi:flavin-dependent dehydrogenase